jgi:hypothetical protein
MNKILREPEGVPCESRLWSVKLTEKPNYCLITSHMWETEGARQTWSVKYTPFDMFYSLQGLNEVYKVAVDWTKLANNYIQRWTLVLDYCYSNFQYYKVSQFKDYCLLGYGTVQPGRHLPTFRRNLQPRTSGQNSNPCRKGQHNTALIDSLLAKVLVLLSLHHHYYAYTLLFYPEDRSSRFLQNNYQKTIILIVPVTRTSYLTLSIVWAESTESQQRYWRAETSLKINFGLQN